MMQVIFMIVTVFFSDPKAEPRSFVVRAPSEEACRAEAVRAKRIMGAEDGVDAVTATCIVHQRPTRD